MNLQAKARVKELVAQHTPPPKLVTGQPTLGQINLPDPRPLPAAVRTPTADTTPDELVIELTGNGAFATCTLRPSEVSRLRGRFGKGPGFEQWVIARIRDAMISFGGG